jgi:hypothetical protein
MKSPHQQQVFEKLRSRFGMPGEAGFSPKSNASFDNAKELPP